MPAIAIINRTTVLDDMQVLEAVKDLQIYLSRDIMAAWGQSASVPPSRAIRYAGASGNSASSVRSTKGASKAAVSGRTARRRRVRTAVVMVTAAVSPRKIHCTAESPGNFV